MMAAATPAGDRGPRMSEVLTEKLPTGVMLVTLNRPDAMNTMGGTLPREFAEAIREARLDNTVRAVLITGAGRAFCAGADLQAGADEPAAPWPSFSRQVGSMQELHDLMSGALFRCPKPTVALVNGAAAGGGFGLALAADFRIASENAIFVSAFARIGLSGDNGVTWGLSRQLGRSTALEILMLSPRITAAEAYALGLVREVVSSEELLATGVVFGERLAAGPTEAFAVMKRNLEYAHTASYAQSLEFEAAGISINTLVGESELAVQAFHDKREPDFRRMRLEAGGPRSC
jgi:2-(1,2-epoxy-1,2-dihydrophenyl)acetyl-CoA isomerase